MYNYYCPYLGRTFELANIVVFGVKWKFISFFLLI